MAQLVAEHVQQGGRGEEDRGRPTGCTFDQFNRQHPPGYSGKGDGIIAENWLLEIKELFEVLECTDAQRVSFAAFKLQGDAKRWWQSTKLLLAQELGQQAITWERFQQEFLDRYFPRTAREAKAREFATLAQGTMTVEQYAARFMELVRFAPYLVPDEERKARKFEEGLYPRIYDRVYSHNLRTLAEVVERAIIVERGLQRTAAYYEQQKRKAPSQPSVPQKPWKRNRQEPPQGQNQGSGEVPNNEGNQLPLCNRCGKRHLGGCRQGVCFQCGKPGHIARYCQVGGDSNAAPRPVQQNNVGRPGGPTQARLYALTPGEADDRTNVVAGKLPLP
jgi:hypothetical protein